MVLLRRVLARGWLSACGSTMVLGQPQTSTRDNVIPAVEAGDWRRPNAHMHSSRPSVVQMLFEKCF